MVWVDAMKWNLPQNLYYTCTKMELDTRVYYILSDIIYWVTYNKLKFIF